MKQEVTLVTGASAGIGRAIAEMLLAQGRRVVNIDYRLPDWRHDRLVSFQADLTREADTRERAAQVAQQFDVTALVNNAGATRPGTIDTQSVADLDYVVALHLRATMLLTQACLPSLRACGRGRAAFIHAETAKWGKVVQACGATAD